MPAKRFSRSRTVPATEFKASCLALMDEVARTGGEIVITKHGKVVAKLVAPTPSLPSAYGWMRGTIASGADLITPEDVWDLDASVFPDR
jgi:prevent-host-death family protein